MADPNIGQIAASTWDNVMGKKPNDVIFNSRALFYTLKNDGFREEADGGRYIEWPIEYAENSNFQGIAEFGTLTTAHIDTFDACQYTIKTIAGTVVWSELEKLRNQVASGKFDVIEAKLKNGKESLINKLNTAFWSDGSGDGGLVPDGIQKIISSTPTTGTVGSISRATYTWWRNQQNAGTQTSSDFDNLRSAMRTTYNQCSLGGVERVPTAFITTRTVMEGYESLLVSNERYEKGEGAPGGDLGFTNNKLKFKGADVFYDEACPASTGYFINPEFLKVAYYKNGWMKMKDTIEPANALTYVQRVFCMCQMATVNSRHLGVVTAIS